MNFHQQTQKKIAGHWWVNCNILYFLCLYMRFFFIQALTFQAEGSVSNTWFIKEIMLHKREKVHFCQFIFQHCWVKHTKANFKNNPKEVSVTMCWNERNGRSKIHRQHGKTWPEQKKQNIINKILNVLVKRIWPRTFQKCTDIICRNT